MVFTDTARITRAKAHAGTVFMNRLMAFKAGRGWFREVKIGRKRGKSKRKCA
jgi:hypothetical protein